MLSSRELDRLTEDWPPEQADLELQLFAGQLRADRPELSGPALSRIEAQIEQALQRSERRGRKRHSTAVTPRARGLGRGRWLVRSIPYAAAASVVLGLGIWATHRPRAADRSGPSPASGTVVKERTEKSHLPPEQPDVPMP